MPKTEEERKAYQREAFKKYRASKGPDWRHQEYLRYKAKYPEKLKELAKATAVRFRLNHPTKSMLTQAKIRAKLRNLPFNLDLEDLVVPEFCPILGIKLEFSYGKGAKQNNPSIDRVDNLKGYTKDNIKIISRRANTYKSNLTVSQVETLLKYMRGQLDN